MQFHTPIGTGMHTIIVAPPDEPRLVEDPPIAKELNHEDSAKTCRSRDAQTCISKLAKRGWSATIEQLQLVPNVDGATTIVLHNNKERQPKRFHLRTSLPHEGLALLTLALGVMRGQISNPTSGDTRNALVSDVESLTHPPSRPPVV